MSDEEQKTRARSDWDIDDALASLDTAGRVHGTYDEVKLAKEVLKAHAPLAAQSIAFLALHSPNEKIRFEAAREILNRNLGTVANVNPLSGDEDPLEALLASVVTDMEDEKVEIAKQKLSGMQDMQE